MIDKAAAVYICRLCRRLSVLTDLAAALERISKHGKIVDLAAVPHPPEHCRLFYAIVEFDMASTPLAVAYWLDQIRGIAVQYAEDDGDRHPNKHAGRLEQQAQEDDLYAAMSNRLKIDLTSSRHMV